MASPITILLAVLASLVALLYTPVKHRAEVTGALRPLSSIQNTHGGDLKIIPDTVHCEDLHHHLPSGLLFTACQGEATGRLSWFPPLAHFDDQDVVDKSKGGIFVIDPKTFKSQKLVLEDFPHALVTHGIDLYSSPSAPESVYIFAVNHLPNPYYYLKNNPGPEVAKASSRIEIFQHTIGTGKAKYLRSVLDPLIRTPNDIFATSPNSFYVTNDHFYREGTMRLIEDIGYQAFAGWSDTVHIEVTDMKATNASTAVKATIAHQGLHNNNGFGHGKNASELLIGSAASGVLHLTTFDPSDPTGKKLKVVEDIQFPSCVDNPSYYTDPYASAPGAADDASGYVLAGLARAIDLEKTSLDPKGVDPVMVWFLRPHSAPSGDGASGGDKWNTTLLFQDDGKTVRTASAAVLVGIDPQENGGKKQAWLFVTGFMSEAMVAQKVDL